jgi:Choline dehydrogenase and related flavoproteins
LANRLSVDPHIRVALLEFGGMDTNPAIYDRSIDAMYSLWEPDAVENWGYTTVPQPGLNGRSIDIARGKVLGGSSAVNAMMHVRGNRRCFDAWAALGNKGWSYEDVLPYFLKSETYHGPISPYHGDNGPVSIIDIRNPSPILHALIEAHFSLGATAKYNDFNGASQEAGAGLYQTSRTLDAIRVTEGSAFVTPILNRANFQLLTQVRVTRILMEKGRAVGVEYDGPDGKQTLRADREVAVCCGAFETPKLMMLSGMGPADHLAEHGIPVVQDLSGVGKNLHDHLLLGTAFESLVDLPPPELAAEAGLFMWTDNGDRQKSPNLQYFFGPVLQPSLMALAPEGLSPTRGFTFTAILNQPLSRGTLTLASSNPADLARVDPQYLTREEDLDVLEFGIRYARELAHASAFDPFRGIEIAPGAAVTGKSELRDYIRTYCGTVWHPVSTCRMGSDAEAVVDDELRVHGVDGLRVVDASVMPNIVNGNPNAAIMMIAEKAADLMRGDQAPLQG